MGDSRLITGPPASGKSRAALDRFLSLADAVLIVPSATMVEHVRNSLARAGALVRPNRILTLARFLDSCAAPAEAPEAVVHLLIQRGLEKLQPPRLAAVAGFRGFHRALAALLEQVPIGALGGPFREELAALFQEVEAGLAARGMALRHERLRNAGPWPANVVLDGFFTFSPPELDLITAIAARSDVTLTLPDWPGSSAARECLLNAGFHEHRHSEVFRAPRQSVFSAPTLERETEEIARRILEEAARGRPFRDMGILLRTRDPYGPALETALARFGIPARLYFFDSLAEHPVIAYLAGVMRVMLGGWDYAELLSLLRMPVSGIGATADGDKFDFETRKELPRRGLPLPARAEFLNGLDSWRRERFDSGEWAIRLKSLRSLLPQPVGTDGQNREQVTVWRSTATALDAFDAALDAAAVALAGPLTLAQFWSQVESALTLEPLRLRDRRRNVVHVMDAYEARQWELPVVFVCGLVERHFPQYHREDPLMNDAARRRAGLRTSAERQAEERFLFELATTRATEQVVLSYSRFNDKGEDLLPSFFLPDAVAETCETRVRPKPASEAFLSPLPSIQDHELREKLAVAHKTLSATSIASFVQCPFQFFASRTLRLRERPPLPRDRLDGRRQGTILHQALASGDFEQAFNDEIARLRIPLTYRTEAVRLELLRHFEAFLADRQFGLRWTSRVEEKFAFPLNPLLTITGRIDRLDVGPCNEALVIDYKYSAADRIRAQIKDNESGESVQGGLYLLAAARQFGLDPIGMLFCGLRRRVVWDGWHLPIAGLEKIGESRIALEDLIYTATAKATETYEAIVTGCVAPQPLDPNKCKHCDFRDICRIETMEAALKAGS